MNSFCRRKKSINFSLLLVQRKSRGRRRTLPQNPQTFRPSFRLFRPREGGEEVIFSFSTFPLPSSCSCNSIGENSTIHSFITSCRWGISASFTRKQKQIVLLLAQQPSVENTRQHLFDPLRRTTLHLPPGRPTSQRLHRPPTLLLCSREQGNPPRKNRQWQHKTTHTTWRAFIVSSWEAPPPPPTWLIRRDSGGTGGGDSRFTIDYPPLYAP